MEVRNREDIIRTIREVAQERGYKVVEKSLDIVVKGLMANKEKYGDYHCPCQIVKDGTQCPCSNLDEQIEEKCQCHCNLYQK